MEVGFGGRLGGWEEVRGGDELECEGVKVRARKGGEEVRDGWEEGGGRDGRFRRIERRGEESEEGFVDGHLVEEGGEGAGEGSKKEARAHLVLRLGRAFIQSFRFVPRSLKLIRNRRTSDLAEKFPFSTLFVVESDELNSLGLGRSRRPPATS